MSYIVEANYIGTQSTARPLCNSRASCLLNGHTVIISAGLGLFIYRYHSEYGKL